MTAVPSLQDATLTVTNRYATLILERDDVRNALTGTALIDDICSAIEWTNANKEVSCLIITGAGSAFSSGGNIKDMRDKVGMFGGSPAEISESYKKGIQRISRTMFEAEVVTIAAVNGAAVGAGFDLCCMADIRIGCENTRFGETFINLGIIPGDGGAWFLQRLVGYQRAAELTFSGRIIESAEALDLGLLLECVPKETLLETAERYAAGYASKPPQALRATKRLMKLAQRQELADFLDVCADVQSQCHHSKDHQRALNAFINKTDAQFEGN
ncbi:Crotonyl-CoA hydratase [Zhongshania aliphaticivorans]|uniref:Crotonyl-CoA hydratase n=1 Tax=Zhongshania aliphaticivorans TaxID=1470434 RepID=A0A5S9NQT4_9GAMM|nr:enoyl-CoA hydratase-related protein [Zhongshania aliphaticivorans]CAA0092853.1 Crotonyl-CoA hydratase [Zhongshania aliphaticivorans]CAA0110422.1 Crotonyl-CoA hydratase [Zhongshania aliphaticivorans]